jgi:hypothetical protein
MVKAVQQELRGRTAGDVQRVLTALHEREDTFVRFECDSRGVLKRLFWAYKEQVSAVLQTVV